MRATGTRIRRLAVAWAAALLVASGASAESRSDDGAAGLLRAGDYEGAARSAREVLAEAPGDAAHWRLLGDALAAVGAREQALEAYASALAHEVDDALEVRLAAVRVRIERGTDENTRRTLEDIRAARLDGTEPSSSDLTAMAGATRLLAGSRPALFREAVRLYGAAIARDGANPRARAELGDLLLEKYNSREASAVYREALEIDEQFLPALLGLARAMHFDGSPEAVRVLERCLELNPNLIGARVLRARLLLDADDLEGAASDVGHALGVNPDSIEALGMRAALAYLADDEQGVRAALERVEALAPKRTDAFATLAEIAAQNRRYADAVRFAWYGVSADPDAPRVRGLLGLNELRVGDMRAGRDNLERAFRGDPFNVWFKNTLDLLDATADYLVVESPSFVSVLRPDEAPVLGPYLAAEAETAYLRYAERYAHQPRTPVRLEVYTRSEDLSVRTVGLLGVDILGVSFGPVVAIDSPSTGAAGGFNWASVVWHELAHTFHLAMSNHRSPRWFSEGLSVHEEHRAGPGWGADPTPSFVIAWRDGRLLSVGELNRAFVRPSYPEQIDHAYFQASMIVALIERDFGLEALRDMLGAFGEGRDTAGAVETVLGLSVEDLDARFESYLDERLGHARTALVKGDGDEPPPYFAALRAGVEAARDGDLERAERSLLEAQSLFPEHAGADSAYPRLARLYQGQGRHGEAIAQLERWIDIDADALEPHLELAGLLMAREDAAGAAAVLERALRIEPFDIRIHQQLADLHEQLEDWPAAAREHGAVVALDAPDPVAARYRHARALHLAGAARKARLEVLRALERAPLYAPALELLLDLRAGASAPAGTAGEAGRHDASPAPAGPT